MKGITIVHKKAKVIVSSEVLKMNPILNMPISGIGISKKFIPATKISINEWFKKIF